MRNRFLIKTKLCLERLIVNCYELEIRFDFAKYICMCFIGFGFGFEILIIDRSLNSSMYSRMNFVLILVWGCVLRDYVGLPKREGYHLTGVIGLHWIILSLKVIFLLLLVSICSSLKILKSTSENIVHMLRSFLWEP